MIDLRTSHGLARAAFVATVLISFVVLFIPASGVPSAPPGTDKLVHVALFAALLATGRWAGFRPGRLAVALVAYGAASEVVQGLAPLARSVSVADWLADVAGVLVGLALWDLIAKRRPPMH